MTDIQSLLSHATMQLSISSDSASLDAEVMLCHVLKKPRSHLRAWPEKNIAPEELAQFLNCLEQRIRGTPIAYITGQKEFWSRAFKVTPDVLIPRPDTELLIELSLNLIKNKAAPTAIDLGTGSGAIAITLAAERPDLKVTASDFSDKALIVAKYNAARHKTNNVSFVQSCWFAHIPSAKFDLIISNPPYIDSADLHLSQGDVRFEPKSALIAEEYGLKDIKTLCQNAPDYLKPEATLLIEHGFEQQSAIQSIFNSFFYHNIKTHKDLSGNPRVTSGQWNPS